MKKLNTVALIVGLTFTTLAAQAKDARLTSLLVQGDFRGNLQSLRIPDGDILALRAANGHQAFTVTASAGLLRPPTTRIRIKLNGRRTSTALSYLNMFDYETNRWETVGTMYLSRSLFAVTQLNITNRPGRFVSGLGNMKLRVLTDSIFTDVDVLLIQLNP